jgi:hypothetical protein
MIPQNDKILYSYTHRLLICRYRRLSTRAGPCVCVEYTHHHSMRHDEAFLLLIFLRRRERFCLGAVCVCVCVCGRAKERMENMHVCTMCKIWVHVHVHTHTHTHTHTLTRFLYLRLILLDASVDVEVRALGDLVMLKMILMVKRVDRRKYIYFVSRSTHRMGRTKMWVIHTHTVKDLLYVSIHNTHTHTHKYAHTPHTHTLTRKYTHTHTHLGNPIRRFLLVYFLIEHERV